MSPMPPDQIIMTWLVWKTSEESAVKDDSKCRLNPSGHAWLDLLDIGQNRQAPRH
jgi:hypothetical protein